MQIKVTLILEHIRTSAGARFSTYTSDEDRRVQLIQYFNEVHADGDDDALKDDAELEYVVEQIEDYEDVSVEEITTMVDVDVKINDGAANQLARFVQLIDRDDDGDAMLDAEGLDTLQTIADQIVAIATPASKDLRANDPASWLSTVWDGLQAYREDLIPEGDESYDETWSDICTAMAWITEALDAQEPGLVSCPSCNELIEFDNLAESERTHQQWHCPHCGSWNDRADRDEVKPARPAQQFHGISHYLDAELERTIVRALRCYVSEYTGAAPDTEILIAENYADALENDTYLLETATPRDEAEEDA